MAIVALGPQRRMEPGSHGGWGKTLQVPNVQSPAGAIPGSITAMFASPEVGDFSLRMATRTVHRWLALLEECRCAWCFLGKSWKTCSCVRVC